MAIHNGTSEQTMNLCIFNQLRSPLDEHGIPRQVVPFCGSRQCKVVGILKMIAATSNDICYETKN